MGLNLCTDVHRSIFVMAPKSEITTCPRKGGRHTKCGVDTVDISLNGDAALPRANT